MKIRFALNASIFAGLLSLSLGLFASGQAVPPPNLLSNEPLEKFEDPPAFIYRTGVSPGMVSQFDVFTSHQVNVNASGQNITGDAANEPNICVDVTNGDKISIGWRQFDSVSSNFRQAGWAYTTNGGTSWTFPGVLESNVFRSDPVLGSDDTGRFYYLSLLQTFFDNMWRSTNGGMTYTNLGPATGGDKQWFTVDNTNSTGHGFQYQSWSTAGNNYGGRQFSRSTDGGVAWMNPINIPNSPQWGTLDVDSNGILFLNGVNGGTNQIWCIRSSNARNGAVTPIFDQSTAVNLGGIVTASASINPGGLLGQLYVAVDRSGTSTNNNVYVLASVRPTGASNGSAVMFARSTNSGTTFSAPIRVNDDPVNQNKWHWFGTLSVAPNSRIDVIWLDTRNAANNTDSQLFYSYSLDGGVTFAPNIQVSNSFNPFLGYPNQNKMGDYMGIVSDNTGGNVAYAATFNSEEDIYYVRVAPPAPTLQSVVSRKTHGAAGNFEVVLPLTGTPGIECRTGGATNDYQIVLTFATSVAVIGNQPAQIIAGTATIGTNGTPNGGMVTVSGSTVTIPLTNVANAQTINVKLTGVNGASNYVIPMSILNGDVSANGMVNATDTSQAKSESGQPVSGANFRSDVNANGSINATDVGLVKASVGTALP